jgi:GTPase Era involved in 16S rRNA processing
VEEERIAETLRGVETPVLILINKIDLVSKGNSCR